MIISVAPPIRCSLADVLLLQRSDQETMSEDTWTTPQGTKRREKTFSPEIEAEHDAICEEAEEIDKEIQKYPERLKKGVFVIDYGSSNMVHPKDRTSTILSTSRDDTNRRFECIRPRFKCRCDVRKMLETLEISLEWKQMGKDIVLILQGHGKMVNGSTLLLADPDRDCTCKETDDGAIRIEDIAELLARFPQYNFTVLVLCCRTRDANDNVDTKPCAKANVSLVMGCLPGEVLYGGLPYSPPKQALLKVLDGNSPRAALDIISNTTVLRGYKFEVDRLDIYDKLEQEYVQRAVVKFMWDSRAPFIAVENCLIKDIDQRLQNELQYGDLILSINGQKTKNDIEINAMLEKVAAAASPDTEFEYSFLVKRPVAPVPATKADLPTAELQETETMKVLKAYVVLYPQSAIGIKVKDIFGKVIVSTVDPSYRSISKNIFNVGDYILSINDEMMTRKEELKAAFTRIKEEKMENFKVVFKRAFTPQDVARVRGWLNASAKDGYTAPVMAADVAELCAREIQRLTTGNITIPPSIYVPPEHAPPAKDRRLKVAESPRKVDIGIEPEIVRKNLMKVPKSATGVLHETMTLSVNEPKPNAAATAKLPPAEAQFRSKRGVVKKSKRSTRTEGNNATK